MSFLLDTNVVSEWARPQPHRGVIAWLAEADEDAVFLSVVTLAELRRGVDRLPGGRRRERLEVWLRDELPLRFTGRLLGIDEGVADAWGRLVARSEASGRAISAMDGFIAATAVVHGLSLVTRNVADFRGVLPTIVNPWSRTDQ
jgi:predicted nucleic acid-binding protein